MIRATFAGFSTALSALQANQKRLDITGQNLANMNTAGYTRQQLKTSSLNYTNPISHYMNGSEISVGFGVKMDGVTQIRDPYLDAQYRSQIQKSGYTDSIQTSLDRLSRFLDESHIKGINQAFTNINATLELMHDPLNVNDPIFESELRSRMQALTNLLNDGARKITEAEKSEFSTLDGTGTSEMGSVQQINTMLEQIGQLNRQIKQNQIYGQPSLELMDERNLLLDELASFIPIEVSYYQDYVLDGSHSSGLENSSGAYHTDSKGNAIAKKDWPSDLRVEMTYVDDKGTSHKITLVEGTIGTGRDNIGKLTMTKEDGTAADINDPTNVALTFTDPTKAAPNNSVTLSNGTNQFPSGAGSVQGSLDMLWKKGTGDPVNNVKGYEYYRDELDNLAKSFATVMNTLNGLYEPTGLNGQPPANADAVNSTTTNKFAILTNKEDSTDPDITAANIGISQDWVNGTIHISTQGENSNDTVSNMLEAMTATYPYSKLTINNTPLFDKNSTTPINLRNNSFADFINSTSAILANDSYSNTEALKNNVIVLNGIQNSRDSISGISLDEEASNMMMFMSAYNAASRLMTTLDEALNTLINGTGVVGR
ncbi:MAG: flagellar biosynthesis protein FlgK [Hungatella sp.]|nr:flagellar biosynthesis protein FlgK [Hungatella sp.]